LTLFLRDFGLSNFASSIARSIAGLDLYGVGAGVTGGYRGGILLNQLIGNSFGLEYLLDSAPCSGCGVILIDFTNDHIN
jgi:hypothetical protein